MIALRTNIYLASFSYINFFLALDLQNIFWTTIKSRQETQVNNIDISFWQFYNQIQNVKFISYPTNVFNVNLLTLRVKILSKNNTPTEALIFYS